MSESSPKPGWQIPNEHPTKNCPDLQIQDDRNTQVIIMSEIWAPPHLMSDHHIPC